MLPDFGQHARTVSCFEDGPSASRGNLRLPACGRLVGGAPGHAMVLPHQPPELITSDAALVIDHMRSRRRIRSCHSRKRQLWAGWLHCYQLRYTGINIYAITGKLGEVACFEANRQRGHVPGSTGIHRPPVSSGIMHTRGNSDAVFCPDTESQLKQVTSCRLRLCSHTYSDEQRFHNDEFLHTPPPDNEN